MTSPETDSNQARSSEIQSDAANVADGDSTEKHNVLTLVVHQVCFRTAWIFKTESVIMPAFLDTISDSGWVRGMLPPLNRFGQSLAPLLLSERLSRTTRKSDWLFRSTFLMGLPFLLVGALLLISNQPTTMLVVVFLLSYSLFFCVNGVTQAAYNTIQGKLIRPQRRGRLVAIAGFVGSPVAVTMAWLLLRPWTRQQPPAFAYIFLFTGAVFLIASFAVLWVKEFPDPVKTHRALSLRNRLREARTHLKDDRNLRMLCGLAALFVCSQLLFPHYQRLGQGIHGFEGQLLMVWVIVQNLSAAVFSWAAGRLADSKGTRAALRWLTFFAMFAPVGALLIREYASASWFSVAYVLLGAVPVTYRMFLNYALELTDRKWHPIYVSTVVICMAPPIVFSPLVGELVDQMDYTLPFLAISILLVAAWLMTLSIVEPRELATPAKAQTS